MQEASGQEDKSAAANAQSKLAENGIASIGPRIAPKYLVRRTKRQLLGSTIMSVFLILLSTSALSSEQFNIAWKSLTWSAFIVGIFSIFRNRIMDWVYRRVSFVSHRRAKSVLMWPFVIFSCVVFSFMLFGLPGPRVLFGPIAAAGLVMFGVLWAIGTVISAEGETNLLFAQTAFELKSSDLIHSFKWLDVCLCTLARVLKRYGLKIDAPSLKLGIRLHYLEQGRSLDIVNTLSKAVSNMESANQFRDLEALIEKLHADGEKARSKGFLCLPNLLEYLDLRYLSMTNVNQLLAAIAAALAIVHLLISGHASW